jgi:hypothetical protein
MQRLRIQPDGAFMNHWFSASKKKLSTFKTQNLSNSLYSLAILSIPPEPHWLKVWRQQTNKELPQFSEEGLTVSLFSTAILAQCGADRDTCQDIAQMLLDKIKERGEFKDMQGHAQIYQACKALALEAPAWINPNRVLKLLKDSDKSGSNYENVMAEALNELRKKDASIIRVTPQAPHPVTLTDADFNITIRPEGQNEDHTVWLQIDGPSHETRSLDGNNVTEGATLLRNRLMTMEAAPNEHLVCMPTDYDLTPASAKEAFLEAKQKAFQEPGKAEEKAEEPAQEPTTAVQSTAAQRFAERYKNFGIGG